MSPADLHSDLVRVSLWTDVPDIVLGIVLSTVGIIAAVLYRIRARTKDPPLLWFGLFAFLYGLRLLARTSVLPFMAVPMPRGLWLYFIACITYIIAIPATLFVREIVPRWRPILKWALLFQVAFAVCGLISDFVLRRPESLHLFNNVVVLAAWAAFGISLFLKRNRDPDLLALRSGFLVFGATVLINNLSSLQLFALPFDPEPFGFVVFLAALGRLVAQRTIHNEERLVSLDKELEIARKIQASILPRENPRTAHIRVASRYLSMTAVAGDFYDFLIMDENRIGILIADVSGHGVPAALIASMVKIAIASQHEYADDPARVLTGINETLSGKLKGQFVTAAYVFIDTGRNFVRYSAAGHPPLLWHHASNGGVAELLQKGLVLGARKNSVYTTLEQPLAPGDRLLLYTDGLLEARDTAGEQFGSERLSKLMADSDSPDVEAAATAIVDGLARWTGKGPQEDDLTLVLIALA